MTSIVIPPIHSESGRLSFSAIAGNKRAKGKTASEALDVLNEQLGNNDSTTLIVLQNYRPDRFFTSEQQERLNVLMKLWRSTKDSGEELPQKQQDELDSLMEQELLAAAKRATALKNELNK